MESQRTRYGWALKLDAGEEIVTTLAAFAERESVRAAAISALGAVGDPELGYFVRSTHEYVRRSFPGEWEIGCLTGNFSELEGRSFLHCHVVIGGPDFVAWTGHLFRGVVTLTCEAQIILDPGVLHRVQRPDLGFNPLALGPRPSKT